MSEHMDKNGSEQNSSKTSCKPDAYPYLCEAVLNGIIPESPSRRSF